MLRPLEALFYAGFSRIQDPFLSSAFPDQMPKLIFPVFLFHKLHICLIHWNFLICAASNIRINNIRILGRKLRINQCNVEAEFHSTPLASRSWQNRVLVKERIQ